MSDAADPRPAAPAASSTSGAPGDGHPSGSGHQHAAARRLRAWGWRLGTPLVVLACGALFMVSAHNSQGTDLRPGRYTSLATLVDQEAQNYAALEQQLGDLNDEVARLTETVDDRDVQRYQRQVATLEDPAGMVPRSGPGVRVTLADAPPSVIEATSLDVNRLVVHQQDIQAVVNAMWKAGATAVTVQGQRVITTTGIKCEGNAVQLQGVPYAQPYVIEAVGDQAALVSALEGDDYLAYYRADATNPDVQIGWQLDLEPFVTAPAYEGLLDLSYATVLRGPD